MKALFPGYYKPSELEFKNLWQEATVVFDTNVLFDVYRVSDETARVLINTIKYYSENNRLFIPYRVAFEYHRKLLSVIQGQKKNYDDALGHLKTFQGKLREKRSHPFLSDKLNNRLTNLIGEIGAEFEEKKKKFDKILLEASIKDKLADLLNGKVGAVYSEEEFGEILKEGERRFKNKIPPGYKDSEKSNDDQFGDYVVWKETLDYAKENSKSIIFVSSDRKDDWYLKSNGLCYGPQPALIKEFHEYTGNTIYLYSLEQFLHHVNEENILEISNESIEEVKEVINTARETDFGASSPTFHNEVLENAQKLSEIWRAARFETSPAFEAVTGTARKLSSMTEFADRLGQATLQNTPVGQTMKTLANVTSAINGQKNVQD